MAQRRQGCIKLTILSLRGTSGERTEERGNQQKRASSPPSDEREGELKEPDAGLQWRSPTPKSVACLRVMSRTPHKEIDQSADEMCKQNDQNPNNLFVVLIPFLRRTINEHPNPEDRAEQTDGQKQRTKHELKDAK
jgi:hypothetical protein